VGTGGLSDSLVARFNANGTPATGFGSAGQSAFNLGTTAATFTAVALQPNGQIVVAGAASDDSHLENAVIVNAAGTDDVNSVVARIDGATPMTLPPTVQFAAATSRFSETAGVVHITVKLSAASTKQVTVKYAVIGGTARRRVNYVLPTGKLIFAPGQTSKSIAVGLIDDKINDPNETVQVQLSAPTNAVLGDTITHVLTIVDHDPPPQVQFTLARTQFNESSGLVHVQVSLSAPSGKTVTVKYQASGGTAKNGGVDFWLSPGQLTFQPGQTSRIITIALVNDKVHDLNESLLLSLFSPVNAVLGVRKTQVLSIIDNV
jgi:hypothetical protein